MSNIYNHNRNIFEFNISKRNYWDFQLSIGQHYTEQSEGLTTKCLSAYVETTDPNCVWFDTLTSKKEYVWDAAVNNGLTLKNVGLTGIDNGFIRYEKDRISNKQFYDIFLNTSYNIEKDDLRLTLLKVNGNNQIYDYSNDIVEEDGMVVSKLNGGFYQGVMHINSDYQILPLTIDNGWNVEIVLKKDDFINGKTTLNDVHEENKGMFFYIGTRAENKWWKNYLTEDEIESSCNYYTLNEYVNSEYFINECSGDKYVKKVSNNIYDMDTSYVNYDTYECTDATFGNGFMKKDNGNEEDTGKQYVLNEYINEEEQVDEKDIRTSDGYNVFQPNIIEYKTDNKFITFNRAKDGFNIDNYDDNTEVVLSDIKVPDLENYFILFNHTKDGYDIDTINNLIDKENKRYEILNDIYRNALGFQIKDDGSIGYKYIIKDCDSDEEQYKVESEFSKPYIISNSEWKVVNISIEPISNYTAIKDGTCYQDTKFSDTMRIKICVNGKLCLLSKELPMINLKKLDDLDTRQELVPFNISLGGGTQGLCDVIYSDFRNLPKYKLPLEREFAGSFIGYVKSFKMYTCSMTIQQIRNNFKYEQNS